MYSIIYSYMYEVTKTFFFYIRIVYLYCHFSLLYSNKQTPLSCTHFLYHTYMNTISCRCTLHLCIRASHSSVYSTFYRLRREMTLFSLLVMCSSVYSLDLDTQWRDILAGICAFNACSCRYCFPFPL